MSLHRAGLGEALVTHAADEGSFSCMGADVCAQVPDLGKCLVTHRANKRLFSQVHCPLVPPQAPAELEPDWTPGAGKWLLRAVDPLVSPQMCQHDE